MQHHAFLFTQGDNTVSNKIFGKIKLLSHSGHLDEKKCLEQYFPISYLSDMNDLAMTCRDYKNALNTEIFGKHPVSRANNGNIKKGVIDR